MIYTFGSSLTKYYWPTWADWLAVYKGPVTNFAYPGFDVTKVYWDLVDKRDLLTKDDHVYIMWPGNTTLSIWYDLSCINKHDILDFFPNTQGNLWYTNNHAWQGLYKQHPKYSPSFTHLLVNNIKCMLDAQFLLENIGCRYTMLFNLNPWIDIRPEYGETYKTIWDTILTIDDSTVREAYNILSLSPVQKLLPLIKVENFIGIPDDLSDLKAYKGIWEYDISNKEYISLKNSNDMHPTSLSHHDYLLEKILGQDHMSGKHRNLAIKISKEASEMEIPKFSEQDYVASPEMQLLKFNLNNL